jgi:hypothetical protein
MTPCDLDVAFTMAHLNPVRWNTWSASISAAVSINGVNGAPTMIWAAVRLTIVQAAGETDAASTAKSTTLIAWVIAAMVVPSEPQ